MRPHILMFILSALAAATNVFAQPAASFGARPTNRAFAPTLDGNWKTIIPATDERPAREFVFVPQTKVEPAVSVDLSFDSTAARPIVRYLYHVANGSGAKQSLGRLLIGTGQVVSVDRLGSAWRHMEPQRVGNVSLAGPLQGDATVGLGPGSGELQVELSGPVLPGVVLMRAASGGRIAVQVPEGLTAAQHRELSELSRQGTVDIPTIGPAIPGGVGEPELGFDVLLSRIRLHYASALQRHPHPHGAEFMRILGAIAVEGAQSSDPLVSTGLRELEQLARQPVDGAFQQQLSSALGVCARGLLTGAFPVR